MVASPNVSGDGAEGTAAYFRAMQQEIDALGRASRYPFSAGPSGNLQIYPDPLIKDANGDPVVDFALKYENGNSALSIKPGGAAYGSKQQAVMRDYANKPVYATDEVAGYGLSHPSFSYSMGGFEAQGTGLPTTIGTSVILAAGTAYMYNPVWHVACRLRGANGASNAPDYRVYLRLLDGFTGAVLVTSNEQLFSAGTNVFAINTFERMCIVPPTHIGARVVAEVRAYAPNAPTLTLQAFPSLTVGISMAQYNLLPGLH